MEAKELVFVNGPALEEKVAAFKKSLQANPCNDFTPSAADDRVFVASKTEAAWRTFLAQA